MVPEKLKNRYVEALYASLALKKNRIIYPESILSHGVLLDQRNFEKYHFGVKLIDGILRLNGF